MPQELPSATKSACAQLVGVSMIGTYPGRKYDAYGSYGSKKDLEKSKRTDTELDLFKAACAQPPALPAWPPRPLALVP